jgi:DNA-binding XRE family transcriptional regulator
LRVENGAVIGGLCFKFHNVIKLRSIVVSVRFKTTLTKTTIDNCNYDHYTTHYLLMLRILYMESLSSNKTLQSLGLLIRQSRLNKYTQSGMAKRLGVSRTTMGYIEKGSPSVASGLYFEALTILGLNTLFDDFIISISDINDNNRSRTSPSKVNLPNDF